MLELVVPNAAPTAPSGVNAGSVVTDIVGAPYLVRRSM
jgi:hypothetical protein